MEAGQREGGFCATVNWPKRTTVTDFFSFLDQGRADSVFLARSDYGTSGGCSYYRLLATFKREQQTCAKTVAWACFDKGDQKGECNTVARTWCRKESGGWAVSRD